MVLTYISLGAGVQSTAMYLASCRGHKGIPSADVAIFADPGDEMQHTYDNLERLRKWGEIPIIVVSAGRISSDTIARHNGTKSRFAPAPLFTLAPAGAVGKLMRGCTTEYKVAPIIQKVRELMGYKKGQRVRKEDHANAFIGISTDEQRRAKGAQLHWITHHWPLIMAGMSRQDCLKYLDSVGYPHPGRSACWHCPYRSDAEWLDIKRNHPQEFQKAVEYDLKIRDMSASGVKGKVFIHRSCKPLGEVKFRHEDQMGLWDDECLGMCGV